MSSENQARDSITVYICNCCGKVAIPIAQPALIPGRPNVVNVECHTDGCRHWKQTKDTRDDVSAWYTPITMDASQVGRFIEAVDFLAKES